MQLMGFRVVDHSLKIHHDGRLVSHDPSIMSRWEKRDITGATLKLGSIVHLDLEYTRYMILEMRCLAASRPGKRLNR